MSIYPSARALLNQVLKKYRALDTYVDHGVVRPTFSDGPLTCWFETDFSKPDYFRFQFIRPHPHRRLRNLRLTKYIVGNDGTKTYFSSQERGCRTRIDIEDGLAMAVAGATGISRGAAHTIGALFFEDIGGFELTMLTGLRFRRSRMFDGVMCYRISGEHPRGGRYTVWFGTEDLLLRKLVSHRFRSEEIRFDIRIDASISATRFAVPSYECGSTELLSAPHIVPDTFVR